MKERSTGNTVLVVEGGGRGAALVDKYAQSNHVGKVIAVPCNDLMKLNTDKPVQIYPQLKTTSVKEIVYLCKQKDVDLVDVAEDRAVEAGLVDALIRKGISVVGPTRGAGRIEWDKAFARKLGFHLQLPQPGFDIYTRDELNFALTRMDLESNKPRFIKAAFLAGGKGAKAAKDRGEAKEKIIEVTKMKACKVFLIEDWLEGDAGSQGEEFSLFVISDGEHYRVLGNAQDYKRENNFDEGENTGSMGCSSPTLLATPGLMKESKEIIGKELAELKERGMPYEGVLYFGGMAINKIKGSDNFGYIYEQKPYVIEFNARWGDPEAQALLPGLKGDLFELGKAVSSGDISKVKIGHDKRVRVAVTGASKGYPREEEYRWAKGRQIFGLEEIKKMDGVKLYSGAIKEINGKYYAWGGRLFYIVAEGKDIVEARRMAYRAMSKISVEGNNLHYRKDIGSKDFYIFESF